MTLASHTGKLFRHFQGYTTDASKFLIGFGASAISKFPQGYAQNAAVTSEYSKLIDTGDMATVRYATSCSPFSVLRFLNIAVDQVRWGGSITSDTQNRTIKPMHHETKTTR